MRFSKSTSRGLTNTGCVCESTKPGRTTLPAQSISRTFLRFFFSQGSRRASLVVADRNNLPAEAEDGTVFDDAQFFEVGAAARAGLARRLKCEQLADIDEKSGADSLGPLRPPQTVSVPPRNLQPERDRTTVHLLRPSALFTPFFFANSLASLITRVHMADHAHPRIGRQARARCASPSHLFRRPP